MDQIELAGGELPTNCTVARLIEVLQDMPKDALVYIEGYRAGKNAPYLPWAYVPVLVEALQDGKGMVTVTLYGRLREREHMWVPSTLGHGDKMCSECKITNLEAAAIGQTYCEP